MKSGLQRTVGYVYSPGSVGLESFARVLVDKDRGGLELNGSKFDQDWIRSKVILCPKDLGKTSLR